MSSTEFALVWIPDDLSFDDLHLAMHPDDGTIEFDSTPLRQIMQANAELLLSRDEDVFDLIGAWYSCLRLNGYRHEVAEQYFNRCEATDAFGIARWVAGQDTSH